MAAGQRDIPVLLQPGNGATVRAPGEFLYLKFADREIQAIVTGLDGTQSRVKMVTGDFTAPGGGIDEVELINPDTSTPCAVVITVGDGEFDRKIIQGEVTITPGIRGADGQFVDDTRSTVRLRVAIGNIEPREYTATDLIVNKAVSGLIAAHVTALDDGRVLVSHDSDAWALFRQWPNGEPEQLTPALGTGAGVQVGPLLYIPDAENVPGLGYRLVVNVYDAATLELRRRFVTDAPWVNKASGNPLVECMAYAENRLFISNAQERIDVVGLDGEHLKVIDLEGTNIDFVRGMVVRGGLVHAIGGSGTVTKMAVIDPVTMALVDVGKAQLPGINTSFEGAALTVRDTLLVGKGNGVSEYALEDITITASGSVTSCAGGGFLKTSPIDTQAEIYTQRLDDGRVLMSGEILRAALEIYTGRYMPGNYLDYVYRVRAENLNGISPRTVDSGGKSFLAAGIPDDASGTFPQTLEITLREGLL